MRTGLLLLTLLCLASPVADAEPGKFSGHLSVEVMEDVQHWQNLRLLGDFSFEMPGGRRWTIPAGGILDDQTVPPALRTLPGLPAEEDYRRAAALHGYFTGQRKVAWRDVDQMLYAAALAEGLSEREAKRLYLSVYAGGWRWEVTGSRCFSTCHSPAVRLAWRPDPSLAEVAALTAWLEQQDPDLTELTARLDKMLRKHGPHTLGMRH